MWADSEDTGRLAWRQIQHRAKQKVARVAGNPLRSRTAKREDAKIFALPWAPWFWFWFGDPIGPGALGPRTLSPGALGPRAPGPETLGPGALNPGTL